MRNYEVTFIVDPVLSGDEIKATAQAYVKHLEKEGCKIVHFDEMGLLQLAYPINRRTSGIYYCVEFEVESGALIDNLELAFRRDERIMRFLTVSLDKYGVKYNDDKRNGLIGKSKKRKEEPEKAEATIAKPATKKATAAKEIPVEAAAPVVLVAPEVEEISVAETPPIVEETPLATAVEEAPVVEKIITPVVEAEPIVEEAPVVEKIIIPLVEAEPIVEETLDPIVTDEVKSEEE